MDKDESTKIRERIEAQAWEIISEPLAREGVRLTDNEKRLIDLGVIAGMRASQMHYQGEMFSG